VGAHYIRRRGLKPSQVLRLAVSPASTLTRDEFEALRGSIEKRFGPQTQALVLAWAQPYAVECNSIAGALALGFDAALCENSCKPSRVSPYFNSPSAQPFTDHKMRLTMHLAGPGLEATRELIDRGALSDGSLALRPRPPVSVMLLYNNDAPRGVRARLYPPEGPIAGAEVKVRVEPSFVLPAAKRVLMVSTGAMRLDFAGPLDWVPGGLGDHLTSYGGGVDRLGRHGQPRHRQRALQPRAEVSAPAGAAAALPAGQHRHRGLLEKRGLATAVDVHRRAAGGTVRRSELGARCG
jgi:uncharacterized protein (TIGR03790 family)